MLRFWRLGFCLGWLGWNAKVFGSHAHLTAAIKANCNDSFCWKKSRMSLQSDITIWYYSDIKLSHTYHLHLWHDVIHWGALPDQLGQDPNLWKKPDGGRGTCELLDSFRRISVGDRIEPNKTPRPESLLKFISAHRFRGFVACAFQVGGFG